MLHLSSSYILVNDMDRSSEFYSKLFGVKPTIITPDRWIQFDFDGNVLAICNQLFDLKTIVGGGDIDSIYNKAYVSRLSKHRTIFGNNIVHKFQTDDLSKEHSRISKIHGGTISDIMYVNISSPYSFFTITDPDGNILEVFGEYTDPKQQEIDDKDEKITLKSTVLETPPVVTPVTEKPVAAVPVPEKQMVFKPVPEKQVPVEVIPEKPADAEIVPEKQMVFKPVPEKQVPVEVIPEKPDAEIVPEKAETASPAIEKSFKDKSILKAAIEKEKETKAVIQAAEMNNKSRKNDDQSDDQPVFVSPNWEEIADRLKKSVIEKTNRPGTAVKEKEASPIKQEEAEPVKKSGERPGLRPIIAEDKPMVLEDSTDDEPAVMTPIWEESYGKNKKPAVEKNNAAKPAAKEPEHKPEKEAEESPRHKSSTTEKKEIEPEPKKTDEAADLPPIVVKNIRNSTTEKEPDSKQKKTTEEKPVFKPLAKKKEEEKEPKKPEKPAEEEKKPTQETEKPKPIPPPIWEKPSADLWGNNRV